MFPNALQLIRNITHSCPCITAAFPTFERDTTRRAFWFQRECPQLSESSKDAREFCHPSSPAQHSSRQKARRTLLIIIHSPSEVPSSSSSSSFFLCFQTIHELHHPNRRRRRIGVEPSLSHLDVSFKKSPVFKNGLIRSVLNEDAALSIPSFVLFIGPHGVTVGGRPFSQGRTGRELLGTAPKQSKLCRSSRVPYSSLASSSQSARVSAVLVSFRTFSGAWKHEKQHLSLKIERFEFACVSCFCVNPADFYPYKALI